MMQSSNNLKARREGQTGPWKVQGRFPADLEHGRLPNGTLVCDSFLENQSRFYIEIRGQVYNL